ncbi:hypothetical protein ABMA28_015208 [Loxostege sticticalis]|uniref:Transposase n=1 Tax=Loxostege sticticalis TaxID=481309 RepID=A0ABD0TEL7_LOXSC
MASRLSKDVKEVIMRVREFCKEEKYNRQPIIPLNKVNLRVATATGVSIHTVTNIINEAKLAALHGTQIGDKKERKPRSDKVKFSNFDVELVKDIIRDYYKEHDVYPPLSKLLPLVRKHIGYTNSRETFRKILRDMGFVYEKNEKNKWIIKHSSKVHKHPVEIIQMDCDTQETNINHDHDYS